MYVQATRNTVTRESSIVRGLDNKAGIYDSFHYENTIAIAIAKIEMNYS